jgi:hypothetical protein
LPRNTSCKAPAMGICPLVRHSKSAYLEIFEHGHLRPLDALESRDKT